MATHARIGQLIRSNHPAAFRTGQWGHVDPLAELSDMIGPDRVIPVVLPDAIP